MTRFSDGEIVVDLSPDTDRPIAFDKLGFLAVKHEASKFSKKAVIGEVLVRAYNRLDDGPGSEFARLPEPILSPDGSTSLTLKAAA